MRLQSRRRAAGVRQSDDCSEDILRKQWGFTGLRGFRLRRHRRHLPATTRPRRTRRRASRARSKPARISTAAWSTQPAAGGEQRLLKEADIDTSVRRLLDARFQLGMFDPPAMVKYAQIPYTRERQRGASGAGAGDGAQVDRAAEERGPRAAAQQDRSRRIAVIGPNADDAEMLLGNYNGEPTAPVTPLAGIRRKLGRAAKVLYARGSDLAAEHADVRNRSGRRRSSRRTAPDRRPA